MRRIRPFREYLLWGAVFRVASLRLALPKYRPPVVKRHRRSRRCKRSCLGSVTRRFLAMGKVCANREGTRCAWRGWY